MAANLRTNLAFDLDFPDTAHAPAKLETITIAGLRLTVTPVFHAYWRFAAERQNIFYRRLQRTNGMLTADPVLNQYKFTNAYRASDRVSQYLIRNVIYRDDLPRDEINLFFRILLFKLFNKIETWQLLERKIGALTWETFSFEQYDDILSERMSAGGRIYSAAYIMPSAGGRFGHKLKHQNHLGLIESLVRSEFPSRLASSKNMASAYAMLLSAPSIGPFLAYQFATDLNYSALTHFREDEFVVAGPGALDGINKCFVNASEINPADIIRYMCDNQQKHFAEQGIDFPTLWGRSLQLIDCQNLFCEISKYARVAFPEYAGIAGRTRIKQKYRPAGPISTPFYPPDWGLNGKISESLRAN